MQYAVPKLIRDAELSIAASFGENLSAETQTLTQRASADQILAAVAATATNGVSRRKSDAFALSASCL